MQLVQRTTEIIEFDEIAMLSSRRWIYRRFDTAAQSRTVYNLAATLHTATSGLSGGRRTGAGRQRKGSGGECEGTRDSGQREATDL